MLVLCDGGGSNSSSQYLFKEDLQALSNRLELKIHIAHYPPYCSKYNPIEHRVFPHVTRACKGVPLETIETAKHYIEKTETTTGLNVVVPIIDKVYETGRKYAEDFKKMITIEFDKHLPKWNYIPRFPIPSDIGNLFRDCSLVCSQVDAGVVDLTTLGSSGVIDGAIFYQFKAGGAGTGVMDSFVRYKSGTEGVRSGYNTDGALEFDTLGGNFTHSILLNGGGGQVAIPSISIDGIFYREFPFDINEPGGEGSPLSLDQV